MATPVKLDLQNITKIFAPTVALDNVTLPSLYTATLSAQTEIVDQMNIYGVADHAEAAIREDLLERARQLGSNVAQAMLDGDHRWRGDKGGTCPPYAILICWKCSLEQIACSAPFVEYMGILTL